MRVAYNKCRNKMKWKNSSGQAIAELVVGLIALVVVFMGMLLVQQLGVMHTRTLMAARLEAGKNALNNVDPSEPPKWLKSWKAAKGMDTYSAHDVPDFGSPNEVSATVVSYANPSALSGYLPGSTNVPFFVAASDPNSTLDSLCLTCGQASTNQPLDALPFIHWLLGYENGDTSSILLKSEVWLTQTGYGK